MNLHARDAAALLVCAMIGLPAAGAEGTGGARAGEIEVVAGGIGEAELAAITAREKEFNLKLVFSLVQGNYVADVDVTVSDAKGAKVIERSAVGPFVLARLPAGEYSATATRGGRTISRKFKVAAGRLRTEHLRWPADPGQDLPVSRWIDKE
jgi:hypothetical protein